MTDKSQNLLYLSGRLTEAPELSHHSHGETFMRFPLAVKRLSGTYDTVNVLAKENLIYDLRLQPDEHISLRGEIRSFNNRSGTGSRLVICAYAHEIEKITPAWMNQLELSGTICKKPIYRKTPLGREICDIMLAINRRYGRADYLPCIAWGRSAYTASKYDVGTRVNILGRFQSREYIKTIEGIEHPRVTYEVSVSSISEMV